MTIAETASLDRDMEARLTEWGFRPLGPRFLRRRGHENEPMQTPGARSTRAVLLDALGTLVELEPPWTHLAARRGVDPDERIAAAFRAEMAYYREHSDEGRDGPSLAELRRRCAAVLSAELGGAVAVEEMMAAIRFRAFADAAPDFKGLRRIGWGH